MNTIDYRYQSLLQDILDNGVTKQDRTGTGTISLFGRQIRHKMSDGFPLLTTKKMAWKQIVTELLWFLKGDTNTKFLVDNDCHIWDGDVYKRYVTHWGDPIDPVNFELYTSLDLHPDKRLYTKDEFIERIKTIDEFAKTWGELGSIYGKQWRSWTKPWWEESELSIASGGVQGGTYYKPKQTDQIQNLISELKTNPDSRRLMVNAWNVGELDQMVLPPCHYGFQVYTRELTTKERCDAYLKWSNDPKCIEWKNHIENEMGWDYEKPEWVFNEVKKQLDKAQFPTRAISLMWNQRSVDTFLGLPFNIASYGLLLEIIATTVNMVPDELIGNLGDVHLYSNHVEQAKEQIGRTPFELPKLNINTEFWPYEGGSCGEGPLDANMVFEAFKNDNFCKCLLEEDIQLGNYQSHPSIKAPLSN